MYKSVEETVKKDTQPAPKIYKYVPVVAHTQKSSTQKTSTTKPTQTPPKKEEPKQEYSLEDLEKLAEVRTCLETFANCDVVERCWHSN